MDILISNVETLTPKTCRLLLERNNHNRTVRPGLVEMYANEMQAGDWRLNGEPIIIADNGDVMNGQHRLLATVKANVPLTSVVVRNVDRSTFGTIDTGSSRNGADILTIRGFSPEIARITSSAAQFSIVFKYHGTGSISKGRKNAHLSTPFRCADWVVANPRIVEIAETITSFKRAGRIIPAGQAAFLWYLMEQLNYDETQEFWTGFLTGVNLPENDPRLELRKKFDAMKNSRVSWSTTARLGAVVRAWDWFRRGMKVKYASNLFRYETLFPAMKLLIQPEDDRND